MTEIDFSQLSEQVNKGIVLSREELLSLPPRLPGNSEAEAIDGFFRRLAQEPNILGFAISRIDLGGNYAEWFVKDLKKDSGRTFKAINEGRIHLNQITGDRTLPGGFWQMGDKTPKEIIDHYISMQGTVDDSPFFSGRIIGEGLALQGLFVFE